MDRLLRHCAGNLLVLNELNRIAELTGDRQIRLRLQRTPHVGGDGRNHDRSRPFTGAVFDTIVDVYHAALVHEGLADERLLGVDIKDVDQSDMQRISDFTSRAFRARPFMFKSMLIRARDEVALALAHAWPRLDADDLTFENAAATLVDVSDRVAPALAEKFEENFRWREIL